MPRPAYARSMTGIVALALAVGVSVVLGVLYQRHNGRFSQRRRPDDDTEILTPADIGAALGERATLVQFSSSFCAPCRATRVLLNDIAAASDSIKAVEIDAESQLDLVRRLGVMRTPTVFVLDANGAVVTRASGLPRREQVLGALGITR
jgi:thiol-disulfide isomerase/thioredoxin